MIIFFLLFSPAYHPRLILDDSIEEKELGVEEAGGKGGGAGGMLRLALRTVGARVGSGSGVDRRDPLLRLLLLFFLGQMCIFLGLGRAGESGSKHGG